MKQDILQKNADAMLVLTSLNTILDGELTRHINEFKQERKQVFKQLNQLTTNFVYYAEKELNDEVKLAVEQFSGYFHDLISDLNKKTFDNHQLSITTGLCYTIAEVYYNYLAKDDFQHKILFEQIANNARLFAKLNINSFNALKYCNFFKEFTFTLIEQKEFEFNRDEI